MNGLLDNPADVGLLSMGLRLLSTPGKFGAAFGQAGLGAMGDVQQAKAAQDVRKTRAMQEQMQLLQLQQIKAQQERQRAVEGAYRGALESPAQQALAGGGGPTVGNATAMQGMQPRVNQQRLIEGLMQADPMTAYQMMQPEKPRYQTVDGALVQTNAQGGPKSVFERQKPPDWNQLIVTGPDGRPMLNQLLLDAKGQIAEKGAARQSVSVDAGPKAFWSDYGKIAADALFKEREGAQAGASVLQSVQEIKKAAQGGAYQGAGAELKLGAAKALGALGMPYDAATVANTEAFNAQANKFVLDSIKQLGANPSNADREFIEKTVPRLQTDPAALPVLLSFIEGKAQRQIRAFNSKASNVAKKPGAQFLPFELSVPEPGGGDGWDIKPVPGR